MERLAAPPIEEARGEEGEAASLFWPAGALARVDGRWYARVDDRGARGGSVRVVSSKLTLAQSKQLLTAFYLLCIERVSDADVRQACALVLYRYMVTRGYTARWLGKYEQGARYIGNGNERRVFERHSHYETPRLPVEVLQKLCDEHGHVVPRGWKGSRSKYRQPSGIARYVQKRRLERTAHDERRMRDDADDDAPLFPA